MFKSKKIPKKAKLSIAPLLDMIFILLIFFVVSTTFSKLPGVMINRPEATVSDRLPPNNILIGITQKGEFYINKKQYSQAEIKQKLDLKYKRNPKLSVLIIADKESPIKFTITAMDICKQVGITAISIAEEIKK